MTAHASAPPTAPAMLSLEEARQRMLEGLDPLPAESVALESALGRVLAEPLASLLTLPPWDNSAMDGYAVRAADVTDARAQKPVALRVVGETAAGELPARRVQPGTAVRIFTGAPMPPAADAVVPVEDTDLAAADSDAPGGSPPPGRPPDEGGTGRVLVLRPARAGAHVRRAGSDLHAGQPLLAAGTALRPADVPLAAAGGHGSLPVYRRPCVAVLATGNELVRAGTEPGPARIPDSNSPGLLAQALEAGAEARALGVAPDDLGAVTDRLRAVLGWADVVVVSGGVSVGAHDVVKDAFGQLGTLDLWRVAVQPGKPLAFARAREADRAVLLFGLPGNPVSSFVTFELFVRPVLRRLAGHADVVGRETIRAVLAEPVSKSPGRRAFLRVRLEPTADGQTPAWRAWLAGGQSSHVLSALAAADGLAIVAEEVDGLPTGSEVDVLRLDASRALMAADRARPRDASAPRRERRRLTHVDRGGRPRMVDVSEKPLTARRAVAEAFVSLEPETLSLIIDGEVPKGDVLTAAELAGVMGGKRTAELIPLCHPLPLTDMSVEIKPERAAGGLRVRASAATTAQTGVEMEALTAATVAALTVYDMVKGVDQTAEIREVRLLEKSGGRSGEWRRNSMPGDRPAGRRRPGHGSRGPRRAG